MRLLPQKWIYAAGLSLLLLACVPPHQYEPLTLTTLNTGGSRTVTIEASGLWRDTGIEMRRDEAYQVETRGKWWPGGFCGEVDASGLAVESIACMKAFFAPSFPMPEGRIGAVVGRIGPAGQPFVVGGTRGFIANANGTLYLRMNDPDDLMFDNVGQIDVMVQRHREGGSSPSWSTAETSSGSAVSSPSQPSIPASGYYAAERDITFNVLENVEFDPVSGELSLSGRFDPKYAGPRIPYLQHLATFLDNPGPQVSLDWTPDFERKVDAFFRRMDDVGEMADLVGGGQLMDANDRVTRKGRLFLPLFGVNAFAHGNAPGSLGVTTSSVEVGLVRVDSVVPGSAADRAGIEPGDDIHMLTYDEVGHQPVIPSWLLRDVRFAGAGAPVTIMLANSSGFRNAEATLDAYQGDPWEHVDQYDIRASIYRAVEKHKAAALMDAIGDLLRDADSAAGELAMYSIMWATDTQPIFEEAKARYGNGEITKNEAMRQWAREVARGMEAAMELPYDSMVPTYDWACSQSQDPFGALDVAILELNRLAEPGAKEALRLALYKNDQITMPVAVLDENADYQPLVKPRYINVPAGSELARLFIEADYVGKAIIHRPELSNYIPAYQTEYAFVGSRPGGIEETTNRLWIEPARLDVSRSASQNTLRFGQVQMKFNIGRAMGGGTEYRDDAYGDFLSGIYDDLAGEFTALHELREAAKLSAVAKWLNVRLPGFRLPAEGQAQLFPPEHLEGFVTLIWSPHSAKVSLIAPGGIDFNVPPIGPSGPVFPDARTINVPVDASVVDLGDLSEISTPTIDPRTFAPDSTTIIPARYRRALTAPPLPASVRLVGLATKGQRTLDRIDGIKTQTLSDANRCDATQSRELGARLSEATGIARQLRGAEKALNAITAQANERQRIFAEVEQTLREEEQNIRESMMDMATGGLLDVYDELAGSVQVRSIQDLESLIATMRAAKKKLGVISSDLSNLDLAISSAMASSLNEREQATNGLLGFLKDTLGAGANLLGNDPVTKAKRTAGKTIAVAGEIQAAADTVASLYKINTAVENLQRMDALSESELSGLRDSLLPLQRKLSNRLDGVMNDPLVQDYENGQGKFACGA